MNKLKIDQTKSAKLSLTLNDGCGSSGCCSEVAVL